MHFTILGCHFGIVQSCMMCTKEQCRKEKAGFDCMKGIIKEKLPVD